MFAIIIAPSTDIAPSTYYYSWGIIRTLSQEMIHDDRTYKSVFVTGFTVLLYTSY